MRLPIPDDWNGDEWECVQISWPNSPKWFALLVGFVTQAQRGRFWDEKTGVVKNAQAIGQEIFARNFPFNPCGDTGPIVIDNDTVHLVIAGDCGEDEDNMGSCGYNPKAFKVEDGTLYVRDFCGDWVEIGALSDQPAPPPETELPDPPPTGYVDSTACSMASKLAVFTYNIVVESFSQLVGLETIDLWDYYNDMNDAFPTVDLAFDDLMNMWAQTAVLDVAGFEGETKSLDAVDWLKCFWEGLITPTNSGITEADYLACVAAADSALQAVFPNNGWSGFADEARHLWTRAVQSIGPLDAQKITYYAQPTVGQSCNCPNEYTGAVTWNDTRVIHTETQGAVLESATRIQPNVMEWVIYGGNNDNFQEVHWDEVLTASGDVQEVEIEYELIASDRPGYFPAIAWSDTNPTPTSNYIEPPISTETSSVDYPSPGVQRMIHSWAAPAGLTGQHVDFGVKINPKAQSGNRQRWTLRGTITYSGDAR